MLCGALMLQSKELGCISKESWSKFCTGSGGLPILLVSMPHLVLLLQEGNITFSVLNVSAAFAQLVGSTAHVLLTATTVQPSS